MDRDTAYLLGKVAAYADALSIVRRANDGKINFDDVENILLGLRDAMQESLLDNLIDHCESELFRE